jgi:YHS domain-containing protein
MTKLALAFLLLAPACNSTKAATASAPAATASAPAAAANAPAAAMADPPPIAIGTKMKCAVTGEDFTVSAKTVQVVYKGKRYAFCCADCKPDFEKNPEKFAKN